MVDQEKVDCPLVYSIEMVVSDSEVVSVDTSIININSDTGAVTIYSDVMNLEIKEWTLRVTASSV